MPCDGTQVQDFIDKCQGLDCYATWNNAQGNVTWDGKSTNVTRLTKNKCANHMTRCNETCLDQKEKTCGCAMINVYL